MQLESPTVCLVRITDIVVTGALQEAVLDASGMSTDDKTVTH
jgi:hypothetical protein